MIFINAHEVVLDKTERLHARTAYDQVLGLAMNFIKNCPIDPAKVPYFIPKDRWIAIVACIVP
jgi:hypothetical protein